MPRRLMPDTVHIETIEHDDSDTVTLLYARAVGATVTSHIVRNLSPDACRAMLHDIEAAQARGDSVDDVAAAWAELEGGA